MRYLCNSRLIFLVAMAFAGCTRPPIYSTEYNLDFEYAKNDSIPTQWIISDPNTTGYSVHVDTLVKQHGHSSARLQWDCLLYTSPSPRDS